MSAISELSTVHRTKAQTPEEKRLRAKEAGRDNKAGYLFRLPWLIGLVVITIGPMIASLYLSFTNYSLIQAPKWIGLDNYARMLTDERLHNSLKVTFIYVLVSTPLQLAVALAIALLLNEGMKGLPFYRSIFYLPSMLGASVAIAVLWRQMFEVDGLVNQVLRLFGFEATISWIGDPSTALSPIIFFNLVLQIINAFQAFTQAYVVSNGSGGPSDSTMFYTLYLYQKGFVQFQMGYASAMAWVLVVIIAAFTAINLWFSKRWVFYGD